MPNRSKQSLASVFLLALFSIALSCGGKSKGKPPSGQVDINTNDDKVLLQLEDAEDGLTIVLSDGKEQGPAVLRSTIAPAVSLSDAKAKQLLSRMPALNAPGSDTKSFAFRERSKPAPRTATKISHSFPPPPNSAVAPKTGGVLKVTRVSPEGKVPLAPHMSVTFSQPMVAITSHDDSVKSIPVSISPSSPGTWRWIGTKTLLFDPDVRFPMATSYTVTIPAGTRSANGESLAAEKKFTFSTPPVTLKGQYPNNGVQGLTPLIYLGFDQRIDPASIVKLLQVGSSQKNRVGLRMATEEEIKKDKAVMGLVESAKKRDNGRRWIVVKPTSPLPKASTIAVTLPVGSPSAEGPLLTKSDQSFSFETYGPLRLVEARCGWGECPPGSSFSLHFSNPLDEESFDAASLKVSPKLAGLKVHVNREWMTIRGRTEGRTTYSVTVPASLTDTFGQTLGADETRVFKIGDARPQLYGANGITVSDPNAKKPTYEIHSINVRSLDVQIYKVTPKDWEAYLRFMRGNPRRPQPAPGTKVFDQNISLTGNADKMMDTQIDLTSAMNKSGKGHAVVIVKPTNWPNRYKPEIKVWVQVTDIGLDAFSDQSEMITWATDLATGKPLAGVALSITHTSQKATSDKNGLATLVLGKKSAAKGEHQMILASKGEDTAILPQGIYAWSDSTSYLARNTQDRFQWYVFDDRAMYKPGEKVSLKGWIRRYENREGGDVVSAGSRATLRYTVKGPRGNKITAGSTKLNALGGFDLAFSLPKTPNLGYARVEFSLASQAAASTTFSHGFQIQEFRRPEFEVSSKASQGPHIVGKGADVTVSAKYYAGGPLGGAEVNWNINSNPTSYTPPNQSDYSFGSWVPWWGYNRWDSSQDKGNANSYLSHTAKTDASGKQVLHMDFVSVKPPRPMSVVAQASVMDVNRQAWATTSTLLVHPSELYIGLKRDRYFVEKGQPIVMDGVVVDQEGNIVVDWPATVRAVRVGWEYKNGEYKQTEEDIQTCSVTSAAKAFHCEFLTKEGGTYKITATVTDSAGRPNQTELTTWVSGGEQPPERNVVQEQVTLIPDRKEYAGGQTAKILVQAPFYPADGVLTLRRSGIETTTSFHMDTASKTITVDIREGHVPNVYAQVNLVGSAVRVDDKGKKQPSLPRRPAYAVGTINLSVPPTKRTLKVVVDPKHKKLAPGSKSSISVQVLEADGSPAKNTDVVVMVVDEAVLALSSYKTPDPMSAFYGQRSAGGSDYHQRQWVKLARPDLGTLAGGSPEESEEGVMGGAMSFDDDDEMANAEAAPMADTTARPMKKNKAGAPPPPPSPAPSSDKSVGQQANGPIAVRKNFDALAAFAPSVQTNSEGRATVSISIPDNLTRYRVMVIAAAGKNHFGKGESNITARMPLMVRPSPPRFLNFGDKFELPVVLQNQTDTAMKVEVAVRATNAKLSKGQGRLVTVPANDRVEVRFPTSAQMAGIARFQVAASSGQFQDANEFSLPVWTPATTEAFATYGEIDSGAIKQPVAMPSNVVTEFGGLEVTLASTQLQSLTDAFLYLVQYPYECAEQTSSRILGVSALRDVLTAFQSKDMPSQAKILAAVKRDILRLSSMQNWDGGFAFWTKGHESWPYISIYAAHALTAAKAKGFDVPAQMLERSQRYLREIENHIPNYYGIRTRRMLIAYALYVRKQMGDSDPKRANKLIASAGISNLSMESLGWLMSVLHGDSSSKDQLSKLHRYLGNKVSETAATANWVDGYTDDAHLVLYSSRRADGVILQSLIEDKPKSDLIAKVVRGLLAHRKKGRWGNTQENAFVLLALDSYFQAYEKVTPNFVAQLWLGKNFAGEQAFRGRSTDEHSTDIPMSVLAQSRGKQDLVIAKKGKGRLYYRVGMTYAPSNLKLSPADHGFAVERSYEGVDDPSDVVRQSDGSYKIKAGSRVRVRLTMVAQNRRYHVALVDPLPAGLEAMNPALAVTGAIPQDPSAKKGGYWWWNRTWYEHQNMRDERVEAFTSLLWSGVHKYSYVTRATTPGRFVVPPTKAEEMYFPETFGRSASDIVVVE